MAKCALDASAVLALLNQEPGSDTVESFLPEAEISAVNLCEVLGKLIDAGLSESEALSSVNLLELTVVDFDTEMAYLAAALRPATKKQGLSLGDRTCLALGIKHDIPVITAEREWSKIKAGVEIKIIR